MANTKAETMSPANAFMSRRTLLESAGTSLLLAPLGASARFPDPFTSDLPQACRLTCMTTIGPCHTVSPEG
ncbi:MAG: hypothetical protein QM676_13795 [Novosphingobium sp.]